MKLILSHLFIFHLAIHLTNCNGTMVSIFSSLLSAYLTCDYNCPLGKEKINNAVHTSMPDGCGTAALGLPIYLNAANQEYQGFEECCNTHDTCYETCFSIKNNCDTDLANCFKKKCDINKSLSQNLTNSSNEACLAFGRLLVNAVIDFGCPAFISSQMEACMCQ